MDKYINYAPTYFIESHEYRTIWFMMHNIAHAFSEQLTALYT